jgi:hypothetical protein
MQCAETWWTTEAAMPRCAIICCDIPMCIKCGTAGKGCSSTCTGLQVVMPCVCTHPG